MEHQMTKLLSILPLELVIEILSRLPVKPLLRLRCVCKDWCNIIDSKKFINMHLTQSIQSEKNISLLIQGVCRPYPDSYLESYPYSVDIKALEESVAFDIQSWWPKNYSYLGTVIELWGSCNGLVCLSSLFENVALWNPSTKKHFFLPGWSFDDNERYGVSLRVVLGLGFDSITDDYKVVSIAEKVRRGSICGGTEVKICSLRSNSWRRVYGFPNGLHPTGTHGVLVRESLHWLVTLEESSCHSIVAFDLRTEEMRIVPIPSSTAGLMDIHVFEGCLSASFFYHNVGFDLWIMEEYGVEESWTKLVSIHDPKIFTYYHLCPTLYHKNCGLLLIARWTSQVVWHDFETKAIVEVPVRGLPEVINRNFLLLESLVPPDGGCH